MSSMNRRRALLLAVAATGALLPRAAYAAGLQFQISKNKRGEFRWKLRAGNNKVLATSSEGYQAKADCRHAIDLIMHDAASATVVELPEA